MEISNDKIGATVWYAWKAPATGTVAFDTFGSDFDTVLAIWSTTNGLCDINLTNLTANDDDLVNGPQSSVGFSVNAGTTYYIQVSGYDNGGGPTTGNIVLNWNMTAIPTTPSGSFKFATLATLSGSPAYIVSQSDSTSPKDSRLTTYSDLGSRVTVTRVGGSSGRVMVDCIVSALTYTNIFTTNYFGTNISYTYQDTNGIIFQTNYVSATTYASNSYGYYNAGYKFYPVISAFTNVIIFTTNTLGFGSTTRGGGSTTNYGVVPPLNPTTNTLYLNGGSTNLTINADGSALLVITNIFVLPSAFATQVVASASGMTLSTNTLTFEDYQMSANFVVGVSVVNGPDFPAVANAARKAWRIPRPVAGHR